MEQQIVQLTIEVPEELAVRLQPIQHHLIDILELGLRELNPTRYTLSEEIIEFLASGPTPNEIVDFRPSQGVIDCVHDLLYKNQGSILSQDEEEELGEYERLDYLMTLIKARAQLHNPDTGALVPLFNPRLHRWEEHFQLKGALILAVTPIGRATVNLLKLNSRERIRIRQRLLTIHCYP